MSSFEIRNYEIDFPFKFCHDITEILLKVALNTINQTKPFKFKL